MSPEQLSSDGRIDVRTDIYSLGLVLYELLTGRRPHHDDDAVSPGIPRRKAPIPVKGGPAVPWRLRRICIKCMAQVPAERYPNAQELADDLARFLSPRWKRLVPPSLKLVVNYALLPIFLLFCAPLGILVVMLLIGCLEAFWDGGLSEAARSRSWVGLQVVSMLLALSVVALSTLISLRKLGSSEESVGDTFFNRGCHWLSLGEFAKAVTDFDMAIRLAPKRFGAFLNRGIARSKLGMFDEAVNDFTKAIILDWYAGAAYVCRGAAWFAKAEFDNAIKDLTEGIRLLPKDGEGFYWRGRCRYSKGEFEKALEDFTKSLGLEPDSEVATDAYEWLKVCEARCRARIP
jgi:tetratricopeptide (TPR) repeat protein